MEEFATDSQIKIRKWRKWLPQILRFIGRGGHELHERIPFEDFPFFSYSCLSVKFMFKKFFPVYGRECHRFTD
jgi:hypothetical protein